MQEQPPALSPEEVAHLSATQYNHLGQPQTVKVFGILHLIFGGYGVLMLVWSLIVIIFGNPFLKLSGSSPEMDMQAKLQADMIGFTIAATGIYFVVTALIVIAGILLLKGRKSALKWSNGYAWSSIAYKLFSLAYTLLVVIPMTQEMMTTTPGSHALTGGVESIMIGTILVSFLIPLIYPVLSLILLNRPNVKTWLANQPA